MEMDEKFYWFWICNIPGLGNIRIDKLIQIYGTPKAVFDSCEENLMATGILKKSDIIQIMESKANSQIFTEYLSLKQKNIRLITGDDADYPTRLNNIYDRPMCLYLKGSMPEENAPSVAIVGARNCSEYGRQMAYDIGRQLAHAGVNVISGMARGIDGAAHGGALSAGGYTMGVLAGGVDKCYPRENIDIYNKMVVTGGIISEYAPGLEPLAKHFPLRNRIISALSDVVVVVEARERSGSLITVDMALEQNKVVAAVPGRIGDKLSEGCNNLIKMGASIVTGVRDILEILNYETHMDNIQFEQKSFKTLAREEEMLYSCLDLTPKNLNTIIEETGLEMSVIMEFLISLEFKGLIKETARGYYVRARVLI